MSKSFVVLSEEKVQRLKRICKQKDAGAALDFLTYVVAPKLRKRRTCSGRQRRVYREGQF